VEVSVTGRHVEVTPALQQYAETKLSHITIEFPKIIQAHFILEVDKFRHIAELVAQCGNHIVIEARDVSEDLYASIDKVVDKVERQIRKYKTKIQNHQPRHGHSVRHLEEHVYEHDLHEDEGQARHIHTEQHPVKPMSVEEAVLQLELLENRQFLVFFNAATQKVNVLYRRKRGDFGLILPTLA
jgi:putative sigma-54 modulation protein